MAPPVSRSEVTQPVAACVAVAATYVYFLIFAQFGFLQAVTQALGTDAGAIRPVMGVMGLAGIAGSVLAAFGFTPAGGPRRFVLGLGLGGLAALGSRFATGALAFQACALLVGLGTGLATVTLAALLRRTVGVARLGLIIGLGTGAAYAFCNLPAVFTASAATHAWIAVAVTAAGAWAGLGLRAEGAAGEPAADPDYARAGVVAWVTVFLALVGLDSAAFYIIQHTPDLKAGTWAGDLRLWLNAAMHLVAAVGAGWALDRGWIGRTVLLAAGALLAACGLILAHQAAGNAVAYLYTAGVSFYSTALVFYPARAARAGLAATVYAVAGWGGSALAIGAVDGHQTIPPALVAAAGLLLTAAFALRGWRGRG